MHLAAKTLIVRGSLTEVVVVEQRDQSFAVLAAIGELLSDIFVREAMESLEEDLRFLESFRIISNNVLSRKPL